MGVVEISEARGVRAARGSERSVARLERDRRAVALQVAGRSYDEIARECGFADRSGAYKAVRRELARRNREPLEEHRAVVLERLDLLIGSLAPLVRRDDPDLRAAELLSRLNDQYARVLGLYKTPPPPPPPSPVSHDELVRQHPTIRALEAIDEAARFAITQWAQNKYGIGIDITFEGETVVGELDGERLVLSRSELDVDDDVGDDLSIEKYAAQAERVEDEDAVGDDEPVGEWRDGKFYPTQASPPYVPPVMDDAAALAAVEGAWSMR